MTLHPIPLNFLIHEENFILFFISEEWSVSPICRIGGIEHTKNSMTGTVYSLYEFAVPETQAR
jgi:hypothetical protein